MFSSRVMILFAASLFMTEPASALSGRTSTTARRVNNFNFCARPFLDSLSFWPSSDVFEGLGNETFALPYFFIPYSKVPDLDIYNLGVFANLMSSTFGFSSNIVPCANAAAGDFNSTSMGTLVGSCSPVETDVNATEIIETLLDGPLRRLRELEVPQEKKQAHRRIQEEVLVYLTTVCYCRWTAVFTAPKTKWGENTGMSGVSIRSSVETVEDYVETSMGNLRSNKPILLSSSVEGLGDAPEAALETAYTQYTVQYFKKGWNPFYSK
ncbi:hypothetical protein NSK_001254 [Nannochloropsis salina CCMP1776]|uniref:Uncharacterized protein n=1 Tax=Nannochloropsis salina CCMP1776 TaxID=1027361 RepID=A0A4D9DGG0_9STRA|nr:hypothetical protein NSK_001254 [Nannochloropsis salina CCMP1776]|eukprot:TFJ87908.1 hypothetical protein NSK_001254 [Nannochloropsis salina CCMP1776]